MTQFDPSQFVSRIGQRLVWEFEDAGDAGTPGLIGAAREHPARVQLGKLLPAFVSVGTGLIIDSFGGQSKQQDIVVFERDFCPVYSINDLPEATYFPVEGVAATGEVKSNVSKQVLVDALDKIRSAKSLVRYSEKTDAGLGMMASFRRFGASLTYGANKEREYNQSVNIIDQIYTFIICKSFTQAPDTILDNLVEYEKTYGRNQMPDLIISLNDGFIRGLVSSAMSLQPSLQTADSFAFVPGSERSFTYLINDLRQHVLEGRSVPLRALDRYMSSLTAPFPACIYKRFCD